MNGRSHGRLRAGGLGAAAAAAAVLLVFGNGPAGAQETAGPGWLAWQGCWAEVGEAGQVVCVRPTGDAGAEILTIRDGETVETETVHADGVRRDAAREGCEGSERAEFSSDGQRIFRRFDYVCEGGIERRGTGLVAMVSPTEWIRVETTEVGGETAVVTRRFRPASGETPGAAGAADLGGDPPMSVRTARAAASSPITVDDLIEADRELHGEAIRAWLAEQGEPLDVDADALARMADQGVDEEIIDVAVAVSFPEHFVVGRDARGYDRGRAARGGRYGGRFPVRGYRYPLLSPYSRFGYRFGRPAWWYGRDRTTVVVVTPRGDGQGGGRVVSGKGYTRGAPGSARDRVPDARGVDAPSGGSVTPSGARAGGSSGSTGRKAKPRGESSSDDDG